MYYDIGNYMPRAHTLSTECCALNMLRATNLVSFEDLQKEVEINMRPHFDERIEDFVGARKGFGARALFCIVSPGEKILEKNLLLLGFKKKFNFDRRRGYIKGENKFYVLTW